MNIKNGAAAIAGVVGVAVAAFLIGSPFAVVYILLTQ
jgi:hypothetical protein